ncbi:SpaH/EbpB family LPXTG-anchored major pilin [Enterococcus dispar]|uniref:SpaH/EbpB family LPXTG-anchored major pilin n=1 Tax=Enterococcus dispar TaxID=44009 RepID=UPI00288F18C0|nr:SpaH/EbpB family LPXTG-anchored major pilin [Enterococcus dispar]MDT2705399.1 SpaH/EbpB family LPXTG-anchored major pilin [Enterococcus dispar]
MKKGSKWLRILTVVFVLLPLFWMFGGKSVAAKEGKTQGETPAEKQNVTIHKRQFSDGEYPKDLKQNTGKEMTDFGGDPLKGAGFTAYDMTSTYWAAYEAANGDHEAKEEAALAATLKAGLPTESTKATVFALTNDSSDATKDLPVVSNGEKAIYRFVETTKPAGVVSEKSQDFILGLPVYDEVIEEKLATVHVYPKNEVKALNLEFTKYGVDGKGAATTLAGAKFKLRNDSGNYYKDGAFTARETEAEVLESGTAGKVSVPNLTLKPGTYIFLEIDSDVSTSGKQTAENNEIYHYKEKDVVTATVDENMKITYDCFNANQVKEEGKATAEAYNYKTPLVTKVGNDTTVEAGQEITYTITTTVPKDISNYTTFKLVDTFDSRLALISTAEKIVASLKIGDNVVNDVVPAVDVDSNANKVTIALTPSQLVAYKGATITLQIDMKVKPGENLKPINNKVDFVNDFNDKRDTATVKTGGHIFRKIDSVDNSALANAKFVITKTMDSSTYYLVLDNKKGNSVSGIQTMADLKVSWTKVKDDATTLVSDANGAFGVYGLKPGEYQLQETQAPAGYVLLKNALDFIVTDETNAFTNLSDMQVDNKPKGVLPSTGGMGIVGLVAAGILAVGAAGVYFKKGRQKFEA